MSYEKVSQDQGAIQEALGGMFEKILEQATQGSRELLESTGEFAIEATREIIGLNQLVQRTAILKIRAEKIRFLAYQLSHAKEDHEVVGFEGELRRVTGDTLGKLCEHGYTHKNARTYLTALIVKEFEKSGENASNNRVAGLIGNNSD